MKRFISEKLPEKGSPVQLSIGESRHAKRVLRIENGESIEVIDGDGNLVIAELLTTDNDVILKFVEVGDTNELRRAHFPIVLIQSFLKSKSMDWVIEKSVELGVSEFIPLFTDHTVVNMKKKSPEHFQERWQKAANQSLKQCQRLKSMTVHSPLTFIQLMAQLTKDPAPKEMTYWCDEGTRSEKNALHIAEQLRNGPKNQPIEKYRILVGPEGGWSDGEQQELRKIDHSNLFQRTTLGQNVLRSETASLYAVSILSGFLS